MIELTYLKKLSVLISLSLTGLLFGCSQEEMQEDEETAVKQEEVCELPVPENGCKTAYLQGQRSWVKIVDPGELEDPFFLYSAGLTKDPLGTVTVSKEVSSVIIKINDVRVQTVLAEISQQASGFGSVCTLEKDINPAVSEEDPDAVLTIPEEVTYPFYIKISANVCP